MSFFFRSGERQKFRRRHFTAEEDLEEEEEEDKMLSSRIATQTTTTTTNGIVATKKTKKVRFISVCFLSSFAQRFCLVDFLYEERVFGTRWDAATSEE